MEVQEFVRARMSEAESVAARISLVSWHVTDRSYTDRADAERTTFDTSGDPAHVVRTVAAIQRVMIVLDHLADLASDTQSWGVADGVKHAYNSLAWIWRNHPDHDPSWAPDGWLQAAVGGDT